MAISGKIVVITGAGGVLCREFARALAADGAKVALLNRSFDKVELLANELIGQGAEALPFQVDVLDKEGLSKVRASIREAWGPCDILINGAGGNMSKANTSIEYHEGEPATDETSFFDLEDNQIEAVFNVNFMGTLLPTKVFAQDMAGRDDCCVLNISSMAAYHPMTKVLGYAAAKAAVNNLTEWLAVHFSKVGIRVNGLAPGFFATAQNRSLLFDNEGNLTSRSHKIIAGTPMGRFGEPKELVGTVRYLVDSAQSGFVTGITVPVDGGFLAYSGV